MVHGRTRRSRPFLLFSLLWWVASGVSVGRAEEHYSRIVAGRTPRFPNPAVVKVLRYERGIENICSGALITRASILTAWHCVSNRRSQMEVEINGVPTPVRRIRTHPQAHVTSSGLVYNDLAVLRLYRSVPVRPLVILGTRRLVDGEPLVVTGYGLDEYGRLGALREGTTRIDQVTPDFVIATYSAGGGGACNGDSGGPLLAPYHTPHGRRYGIIGVISTGTDPECGVGDISFFANVQSPSARRFISSAAPKANIR